MNPDAQLKLLSRIWNPNKQGFVFLPWIPRDAARTKERRQSWHEDQAFAWPADKAKIRKHLIQHRDDDLYFAPMLFSEPERRSEYAMEGSRLWADLDEVNPEQIAPHLQPTHAWETSPGRFAAIWALGEERSNVTRPGGPNHRLTIFIGADKSGWDTTQLLRVPGSANNKAAYAPGTRGRLVWANRGLHTWDTFDDLPAVEVVSVEHDIDEQVLEGVDRHKVMARVKLKINRQVREFLHMKDSGDLDRSETAWQIERELADAGCSLAEIVAVMRPTVWNKFAGRQDELKRLMTEASKALSKRGEEGPVIEEEAKPDKLVPHYLDADYQNVPEPEWLVDNMIPRGGCGFVAGIPKSMKSWLSLDLAISLVTGAQWLGVRTAPQNVLYIQEEDPASLVNKRHQIIAGSKVPPWQINESTPGNLYMKIYMGYDGTDLAWQAWLRDIVEEYEIDLVIFDTLATIAPGVDIDSGREVKGELLDPIKDIARSTGSTMLIVHHMTKSNVSDRAGQNMAGSGQIHAWADYGFYITKKEEKTGTATVTFNHETKYTGTNVMKFTVEGIDDGQWDPQVQDADTGAEVSGKAANVLIARIREAVPNPDATDPLGADLNMSGHTRLKRAYIKYVMDSGSASVVDLCEATGLAKKGMMKVISFLMNDYPELSDCSITY
ncbi:RecA-like DNA recombinase [Gordonia phage Agatha]|uniref:RecA-like DNA recombinase n=1 Tax=Gordonia phage Agatha TaxID=2584490 RepID=A0A4Y5NZA6_9CAUD|nr:RecA-like DNA recombinase [Gordonia phage Agatha]